MWLDHDSGTMGGTVLEGRFRGRTLDQLSLEDKLALLGECRADPQSAAVLEANAKDLARMPEDDPKYDRLLRPLLGARVQPIIRYWVSRAIA